MSVDSVKQYLKQWNKEKDVLEFSVSSATVALAAEALQVQPARIAKTLSFFSGDTALMVVAAGDARVDNRKFKEQFGVKAKMLTAEQVPLLTGHPVGGVCPFDTAVGARIYLDVSLKRFDTVYPACGSANSAVEMTCAELEACAQGIGWVDVCKDWE